MQDEPEDDFILRDDFNAGVSRLKDFSLAYDILIFARHLQSATAFVDRHPQQVFILDHLGKPRIAENMMTPWREQLIEFAKRPNTYCKFSGLVTEAKSGDWTAAQLRIYWDFALAAFGPERLMFGSDWPVCLIECEYSRWFEIVREFASELSPSEHAAVFGGTAMKAYQLA